MTIRKWFYLFWTTLLVGAVTAIVTGLVLQFSDQQVALGGKEIGFSMLTMFLGGATISVLSQMGFFCISYYSLPVYGNVSPQMDLGYASSHHHCDCAV